MDTYKVMGVIRGKSWIEYFTARSNETARRHASHIMHKAGVDYADVFKVKTMTFSKDTILYIGTIEKRLHRGTKRMAWFYKAGRNDSTWKRLL